MPSFDSPLLMLFVKYPEPGRVKTRLAADAGDEAAARIYRQLVTSVLDALPAGQPVRILYDGFRPEADYRKWLEHPALSDAGFFPQSPGDLGNRLTAAFAEAFRDGWQRVGVIGSDCMELTPKIYGEAWQKLETHDVIIGPTFDGGYYFLALKNEHPSLFASIHWSSERVFDQTLAAAHTAQLTVATLAKLSDIDTLADWDRTQFHRTHSLACPDGKLDN